MTAQRREGHDDVKCYVRIFGSLPEACDGCYSARNALILRSPPLFGIKYSSIYSIGVVSPVFPMETFESVYSRHRDAVLRFAIRCVGRRDVAEELTAEAFMELHLNWSMIDTARLPSWLMACSGPTEEGKAVSDALSGTAKKVSETLKKKK